MTIKIAVFDATSVVGHEILNVIADHETFNVEVIALSNAKQSNKGISFGEKDIKTIAVDDFDFGNCDIYIHAYYSPISTDYIDCAIKANVKVIDVQGHYLLSNDRGAGGQVKSMPSTICQQLLAVLKPLHEVVKVKRVVVSTYESTSAHGKDGMDELFNQSRKFFVHDALDKNVFDKQIAFNVIPKTDDFMDDGRTYSEWRLAAELKTLLDSEIKIAATCVQVSCFIGHGMSVSVEFADGAVDLDAAQAREIWRNTEGLLVIDRESEMEFVTPSEIAGEDHVVISRVRHDSSVDYGLQLWCVADNIRGLVALPVLKELEKLVK